MSIEKFVAVSNKPGLYRMTGNRKDGLIIEDVDTRKRTFAATREYQFTPLAGISIYTTGTDGDDAEPLANVFKNMLAKLESNPPVPEASGTEALRAYMGEVLPNFDRELVKVGDIRKLIRWFNFLQTRDLLIFNEEEETAETESAPAVETAE